MFIESVPNRDSPPAILLRESYRDEYGRAQKRTLANLSKLPGDVVDGLRALLKGGTVIGTGPGELEIERARLKAQHGYAVLWDAHSIRSEIPWLFEGLLPDLNIGTASGASADASITDAVAAAAADLASLPALRSAAAGGRQRIDHEMAIRRLPPRSAGR